METVKLIFKYAYPLDRGRRVLFKERNLGKYPSVETVKKRKGQIEILWAAANKNGRIIKKIVSLTGIILKRDLEMYLFGTGLNAMSKPLIMPIVRASGEKFTNDEYIEIIVHEVCHRFVGDQEEIPRLNKYWNMVRQKYKTENEITQSHIIIYALLTTILKDIFPKKMEGFMKPTDKNYKRAIEIVKATGPEKILVEFKKYSKA